MSLLRALQTALTNLRVNKLRSSLTMLGVIIGVSAVIIMVALVEGVRANIVKEFQRLGSDLIIIAYSPNFKDIREARSFDFMSVEDVEAIKANCDLLSAVTSEISLGSFKARFAGKEMDVTSMGVEPDYSRVRNANVKLGRFISLEDVKNWSKVCVIGSKIRSELSMPQDPIGQSIDIAGSNLTVVGVLEEKGNTNGQDQDKIVLIPTSTSQKRYSGRKSVDVVFAQPKDSAQLDNAMQQVWELLMKRHNNAPGFKIDSQQNILQTIGRILNVFGFVMGGIAGLALLVGGIGVMNIMLVSVTERTREIGIRKAVGAKKKDILIQFLIESATVTGVGGLAGIGLGAVVAYGAGAISRQVMKGGMGNEPGIPIHLPMWSIIGAFAFSAFVGVFFGIYPAFRAANLHPIQALRHE